MSKIERGVCVRLRIIFIVLISPKGWIRDQTGNYDLTFYVAGAGIFLSGFMLIVIPLLYRCDPTARRTAAALRSDCAATTVANQTNHNHNNSNVDDKTLCAAELRLSPSPVLGLGPDSASNSSDITSVRVSEYESVM